MFEVYIMYNLSHSNNFFFSTLIILVIFGINYTIQVKKNPINLIKNYIFTPLHIYLPVFLCIHVRLTSGSRTPRCTPKDLCRYPTLIRKSIYFESMHKLVYDIRILN